MPRLLKRRWTNEELDAKLDAFTSFTADAMMPLEYARAVSRRYGVPEYQVLDAVLRRMRDGRVRLVNGRIPVRRKREDHIRALMGAPPDEALSGWGLFRRLIRYYTDCVRAEGGCSFTLWGEKLGKTFSFLDRSGSWHPDLTNGNWSIFVSSGSCEAFDSLGSPEAGELYLGYPIFARTVLPSKGQTNDAGEEAKEPQLMLSPIFCWRLTADRQHGISGWRISLAEDQPDPEVNLAWLSKALKRADQKRAFLEECGLFDDGRFSIEDTAARKDDDESLPGSTAKLSDWDFRDLSGVISMMFRERLAEPLYPERVVARPALGPGIKAGFYNRAVLFTALPSPYTKRLLSELDFIAKADDAVLDRTALKHFFWRPKAEIAASAEPDGKVSEEAPTPKSSLCLADAVDLKGLEFTVAQRRAVASMLASPVTVVQGPPGTGKSQVVAGVAVNERLRGRTVLISASNHKAIDAVIERIRKLAERLTDAQTAVDSEDTDGQTVTLVTRCNSKNPDEKDFDVLQACDEILRENGQAAHSALQTAAEQRRRAFDALLLRRAKTAAQADRLNAMAADMEDIESARVTLEQREPWLKELGALKAIAPLERTRLLNTLQTLKDCEGSMLRTFLLHPLSTCHLVSWSKQLASSLRPGAPSEASFVQIPEIKPLSLLSKAEPNALQELEEASRNLFERLRLIEDAGELLRKLKDEKRTAAELSADIAEISELLRERALGIVLEDALSRRRLAREGNGTARIANVRNLLRDLRGIDGRRERYFSSELADGLECALVDRPVWAVTSLSVGKFIPPVPGLFDLVLVDEATQSNIAQAIPLLFRARRAAVIGDPKQLQYISSMRPDRDFILRKRAGVLEEGLRRFSFCENSLYDFAAAAVADETARIALDITYRSSLSIAAYSSMNFYGGRLLVGTDEEKLKRRAPAGRFGISWEETKGLVEQVPGGSCICKAEVGSVVDLVKSILLGTDFSGTLGVVSPFARQAQLIDEEVSRRSGIPRERLESADFISSTAHAFQGDERDVIVLSLCSNRTMPPGCLHFISSDPNIFNVAASRARSALIVVGDRDWAKTCGIRHIEGLTRDWQRAFEPKVTEWSPYESPYEKRLGEKLIEEGLAVIPQMRAGVRRLDLALQDGPAKLDIEVDSDAWHRDERGHRRLEDTWRDEELSRLGWHPLRIWTFEIDHDLEGCVDRVKREWSALRNKFSNKNQQA